MINANRVTEMVKNSLFNDDEIIDGIPTTEPIKVNGIMHNIGFHKERLESHRDEVKAMLAELPLVISTRWWRRLFVSPNVYDQRR